MTAQTIYWTDFYALGLVGKLERSAIRLVATRAHQLAKTMRKPRKQDSYSNPVTLIMFLVGPISLYGHIQSVWTWPPYCLMSAWTAGVTAVSWTAFTAGTKTANAANMNSESVKSRWHRLRLWFSPQLGSRTSCHHFL